MKHRWEEKKLGQVCMVIAGQSPEGKYYNTSGEGLPFYQGKKEFNIKYLGSPSTWTTKTTKEANDGDILMSVRAPVGPVNFSTGRICIGRGLAAIRASKDIDKEFLFNFLIKHENEIIGNAGTVFNSINKTQIENISIPLPSLPEQKRIVKILDEVFEKIDKAKENAEKNLQNARDLFESYLESVLGNPGADWEEKRLEEICAIKHGFAFKSEFFTDKGDYVLLTPGNFNEVGGYRDRGHKQKYYSGDIPPDFILTKGDMLVVMTEQAAGLLGSPIIVPESKKFLHNQRLGLVISKPGVPWLSEFFFHIFNTQKVRKKIHDNASGVKVRHTSPTKIGCVSVSFPTSISEQRKFVLIFAELKEETQRLESIYQQKLADLEELKTSVLQKAFNGELTGTQA